MRELIGESEVREKMRKREVRVRGNERREKKYKIIDRRATVTV